MPEEHSTTGTAECPPSALGGGVRIVSVDCDLPSVATAAGVSTRHLIGARLMVRLIDIDQGATVELDGHQQAEHAVLMLGGTVDLMVRDGRASMTVSNAAVVPAGTSCLLTSRNGGSRCLVLSSPPDVELVRELVHLDHADHGFE